MIYGDQGQLGCGCHALGRINAHQQRSRQPRPMRDCDGAQVSPHRTRFAHRLVHHRHDGQYVLPRGHLGEDASVGAMYVDLAGRDQRMD